MTGAKKKHVRVTFDPEGRAVYVLEGSLLIEAAVRAGIVLDTPCGGQGSCGKCRVDITVNAPEPCEADREHFSEEELAKGARLACQTRVTEEMTVQIPVAARFFEQKILTDGEGREVPLEPTVSNHHLVLAEPTLEDQRKGIPQQVQAEQQYHERPHPKEDGAGDLRKDVPIESAHQCT